MCDTLHARRFRFRACTAEDGLVNLTLGDISVLEDVEVAAAAQIAAAVCGVAVGPVTTSVEGVDPTGTETVVCTKNLGAIAFTQNGQSEEASGIAGETPTSPTSPTTTTAATTAKADKCG